MKRTIIIALFIIITGVREGLSQKKFDYNRFALEAKYSKVEFNNFKVSKHLFYFECNDEKSALLVAYLICLNSKRSRNCFNILIKDKKIVLIESDLKGLITRLSNKINYLN